MSFAITNDIVYVGVSDTATDLFEGQYNIPEGITYNSYIIKGGLTAVVDSVDDSFTDEWFKNIDNALCGNEPDYLIVQHMEPDHSGSVDKFARRYKNTTIISSAKAFSMMKQFFGTDYEDRRIVAEADYKLKLGRHTLSFIPAPMVHWPEVMMTYDETDKVLFSADGFGKFGIPSSPDNAENWDDEARRYYIGIVGKYGAPVQTLLKKASTLDIKTICPLHGPVLKGELSHYLDLYGKWSSYEPEEQGVVIAYTSVYGNTKGVAQKL
ncbi:MAG: MBL fold metallo-hydrolase, partial [Ruminiclostridium sp.]|nr:MBL fold metallo-hydrolase [Ruminiclostridium sp.]